MTDRYHVMVRVRERALPGMKAYTWRRVHPVGGDPYVFTKQQAENYIRSQSNAYGYDPKNWQLEPLPD